MIKRKQILSALTLGLLLSGCVKEPLLDSSDNIPDGMALLSVNVTTPSGSVVSTRATAPSTSEQDLTGNCVVMVFDKTDLQTAQLKQSPVTATIKGNNTLTALLKAETTKSYICLAANISTIDKEYLLALTAGATLAEITARLELTATPSGLSAPLPMSGWSGEVLHITKNNPSPISISLSHSVGRIDVDGTVANFTIHGVQLVNGAKKGWVLPQAILPYFGETDVVTYDLSPLSPPATLFTEQLYCFENAGVRGNTSNPTRVVIKGQRAGASSPSYYAIEIVYKGAGPTDKDRYEIERNKIYTIRLNKVDKDGYASYEEASKSEAFNNRIESDITVTDPYAYNIVTNGKQYMGVTNSEFVLYPINKTATPSDLLMTTLAYTCDPGWSEGTLTSPPGIVLASNRLEVQHGSTPLYKDIIVKNIAPGFTEGVVVAHIGNLRQEIKVTVKTPTLATGQIIGDYFALPNLAEEYKVGEIIAPSAETAWLKVSASNVDMGGSSLNDKLTHPEGGIYVHVQPNIGFDASVRPREASLFVSGSKESQRIRIYVQQDKLDIYSGKLQIKPYTYVGTFHRWNQTAERLIRIDASSSLTGTDVWWQATVVAGREFIVLSTEVSKDRGINCVDNPYGVGDNANNKTDEEIEANCQVDGTLRTVRGNSSSVYFKVGLTGRLSGPAATPRYGMIALTYGTGANTIGTHNIYVRQGEAADYLMRPWDASTTPIDPTTGNPSGRPNEFPSSTRPKAVKFGVYNLTDPNPPQQYVNVVDWGPRGYNFVQYPTQGGYYFLSSGTHAIKPNVGYSQGSNLPNPPVFHKDIPWNTAWESCPKGYRRPDDGKGRYTRVGGVIQEYADDIINSEVRQSLWLFPLHTVARSDFSNQLQGYLADGFFDRRPIQEFNLDAKLDDMTYGIVEKGTLDAGYWGFLAFNPHNYASIFVPLSGSYRESGGVQGGVGQGKDGYFHTKTAGGVEDDGWMVACGYFEYSIDGQQKKGYVFDSYEKTSQRTGYSVRCIKDEQPAIGTDDPQVEKPTEGEGSMTINLTYTTGSTLQQQIENKYTETQRKKTNGVIINARTVLNIADYQYLNAWAERTDHRLRHLSIRGVDQLPTGAFTSARWHTITVDTRQIDSNAFASSLSGLKELSLPYLDAITVASGAFDFATSGVQLFLNGEEYNNLNDKEWKGLTWKGIKKL